jgi:pimeloyl-ACP methyl ester carboxylesterase
VSAEVATSTIDVGDLKVHYALEGPEGESVATVVFVHGIGSSLQAWQGQAERLRDRYRVLRYDLRSHGGTTALRSPVDRSDLASDLIGLLDALQIPKAVLVGHSAGGVIAMQTAVDHPSRVTALGLVGTASECNDKTAAWYTKTIELGRTKGGEAVMKSMGMRAGSSPVPDGHGVAEVISAMRTLNAAPLTQALKALKIPSWIIVGEKDFLGVGGSVILSRALDGAELSIVEGRGHGIYLEDPDGFAAGLNTFLERVV